MNSGENSGFLFYSCLSIIHNFWDYNFWFDSILDSEKYEQKHEYNCENEYHTDINDFYILVFNQCILDFDSYFSLSITLSDDDYQSYNDQNQEYG